MNEIVNRCLLKGDKCMLGMYLRLPRCANSVCGPFTKNKERIQKFKETRGSRYIYKNELDKTCFQHDIAYGDFKDIFKRKASHKILRNKTVSTAKIRNMTDVNLDLFQWPIKF